MTNSKSHQLNGSMFEPSIPDSISIASGLKAQFTSRAWKRLIKPDRYIAITEISWLKPDPSSDISPFTGQ